MNKYFVAMNPNTSPETLFVGSIGFWIVLALLATILQGPKIVKITHHGDDWFTVHYSDKTVIVAHYDCDVWFEGAKKQGARITLQSGEVLESAGNQSIPMQIRYARKCHQRLQSIPKIPQTAQKEADVRFP